ncbi:hypothetical protein ACHHRT_05680 [Desulfurivibrio sp. D14AmB]|uniref:hypothetical protein n=1 Tax=Desulfurivibrio sp. D14AmB TaxID=3374370 RepID=UPI00376EF14B
MRCPKCGYISFDREESCDKCGRSLAEVAAALGGPVSRAVSPAFLVAVLRPAAVIEDDAGGQFAPLGVGEPDEFDLGGEVSAEGLELSPEDAGGGLGLAAELASDEFDLDELGAEPAELEPAPAAGSAADELTLETEASVGDELDLGELPAAEDQFSLEASGIELGLEEEPAVGDQLELGEELSGDEFDLGNLPAAEGAERSPESVAPPAEELDLDAVAAPAEPPGADELELTLETPGADELELSWEPGGDELELGLESGGDEPDLAAEESGREDDADGLTDLMDLVYGERQEQSGGGEIEDIAGLFDQPAAGAAPPQPPPAPEISDSGLRLESDDEELDLGLSLEDDEELK